MRGVENVFSDYLSRNPYECTDEKCQICKFVKLDFDISVNAVTMEDIDNGKAKMPFTNRIAWKEAQRNDSDLKRVFAII